MEVTAKKWRPQSFNEFVGQQHIIHSLKNSIQKNKLGHAYLFSGPRGVGKTSCARVFAKALNCLSGGPTPEPCGTCTNCQEIAAGRSMDVIEVDGASNRGIDQIREIRDNLQFLPSSSRYKIYIVDEVHMLTDQAFNALLKTLEEPPPHVLFLFATTEPHKVKITIRSRCQHYRFRRLSLTQISLQLEKILVSNSIDYEPEAVKWIARAADGSMRDSQSLLDQAMIYCGEKITLEKVKEILGVIPEELFLAFFDLLVREDGAGMQDFIHNLYFEGEDIGFFVEELIQQLRYLLLIKYQVPAFQDLEEGYYKKLSAIAPAFTVYQLHKLAELLLNLHKELKTTDQERFILENCFYQALDYRNFVHLGRLVQQLQELEKKLEGKSGVKIVEKKKKKPIEKTPLFPEQKASFPQEKKFDPHPSLKTKDQKEEKPSLNWVNKKESTEELTREPEKVWLEFKAKVAEKSPKGIAILSNVRKMEYEKGLLHLEFVSPYEEGFFRNEKQLISQLKEYFDKFKLEVREIKTSVPKADLGYLKKEEIVDHIKNTFQGEEI